MELERVEYVLLVLIQNVLYVATLAHVQLAKLVMDQIQIKYVCLAIELTVLLAQQITTTVLLANQDTT